MSDGGYAFPSAVAMTNNVNHEPTVIDSVDRALGGMSLRDYFAAKAMAVLLENIANDARYHDLPAEMPLREMMGIRDVATDAYEVADAMLTAREAKS